jgi:hypothetical protein
MMSPAFVNRIRATTDSPNCPTLGYDQRANDKARGKVSRLVVGWLAIGAALAVALPGSHFARAAAGSGRTASEPSYSITDIAPANRRNLLPASVSDNREIVGRSWGPTTRAFAFLGGNVHDIGVPMGFSRSSALAVNDSGVIVASAWNASSDGATRAQQPFVVASVRGRWVWMRLRPTLGFGSATATGISGNGMIAGPNAWTATRTMNTQSCGSVGEGGNMVGRLCCRSIAVS